MRYPEKVLVDPMQNNRVVRLLDVDDEGFHVDVVERVKQVERPLGVMVEQGEVVLDVVITADVVSLVQGFPVCCFRQYGKHKVNVSDNVTWLQVEMTVICQA